LKNLMYAGEIPANASVNQKIVAFPVNPFKAYKLGSDTIPNHLSYLNTLFTMWRGGLNFQFHFPMSKMRKMRLAISWSPEIVNTYSEDLRRIEFTTTESTLVDLSVPWCEISRYMHLYLPNSNTQDYGSSNGFLTLWVLDRISVAGRSTPASQPFFVYISGADDYQVCQLASTTSNGRGLKAFGAFALDKTEPAIQASSSDMYARAQEGNGLSGASGEILKGFTSEDDITNLRELCHRASFVATQAFVQNVPLNLNPFNTSLNCLPNWILAKFLYWRGGVNLHLSSLQGDNIYYITRSNALPDGSYPSGKFSDAGFTLLNTHMTMNKTVSLPYFNVDDCYMNPNFHTVSASVAYSPPTIFINAAGTLTMDIWKSLSDDLSLGVLIPSPLYKFA